QAEIISEPPATLNGLRDPRTLGHRRVQALEDVLPTNLVHLRERRRNLTRPILRAEHRSETLDLLRSTRSHQIHLALFEHRQLRRQTPIRRSRPTTEPLAGLVQSLSHV